MRRRRLFTLSRIAALPARFARRQRGFGAVAAIVVIVMLSALSAAIVRLSYTQQMTSAEDMLGARAFQAASAGTEWGMYKALKGSWAGTGCTGSQTLDLRSAMGFYVTVTCTTQTTAYKEGQDDSGNDIAIRLYIIEAVACNGSAGSCPDNTAAATATYVERKRQSIVSDRDPGF